MNWKNLIEEIQASTGMSQADIGKHVGTRQSTISSFVIGAASEPGYALGAKLIKLHKKATKTSSKICAVGVDLQRQKEAA